MIAQTEIDPPFISPSEYLRAEKVSPIKHEYIDGQVYAMVGASDIHNVICGNIFILLRSHLRGKECMPYIADMKVKPLRKKRYYYPDLLVTCSPKDREKSHVKNYPTVVVEVLSESTESNDRGDKFSAYRTIETLQDYVLVSQRHMMVEVFHRNEHNRWEIYSFEAGDRVELASIKFDCAIEDIYEDVTLPEPHDLDDEDNDLSDD